MKIKYFIGAFLMAILGAATALFAYTRIEKDNQIMLVKDSSGVDVSDARAWLTSLAVQQQPGQVDFTYAAEQTVHGVVHVMTKSTVGYSASNPIMEFFYGPRYGQQPRERTVQGYGSGVIISADGYIITNNHVIDEAEDVEVKLNDNRVLSAEIIGRDPSTDLALLKVDATNLPYVKYGDSDALKLGEWVLAVGNPFNLTSTVTAGIVSAKGRNLDILEGDYRIESFIQTDAALNMGNSGGALVNTKGLLVGITSAIYSPNGAYAGNSFAIPVSIVKKVIDDLKEYGEVQRAFIGVNIEEVTPEKARELKLDEVRGVLIASVNEGGAAEAGGLKNNDVIIQFNGVNVTTVNELQEQVGRHRPGDRVNVTYARNGKQSTVSLVLKNISGNTGVVTRDNSPALVFGARLEPLSAGDRKTYNIDYGVKVTDAGDGRLNDLGIRKGVIILSVNGKRVKSAAEVREATSDEKNLTSIEGIQTNGTFFSYSLRN